MFYSRDISLILHSLPVAIFLLVPLFLKFPNITLMSWFVTLLGFMRGKVMEHGMYIENDIILVVLIFFVCGKNFYKE